MFRLLLTTAAIGVGACLTGVPEAQAQNLVPCAQENDYCRVPYPTRVIYGARGRNVAMYVRGRGVRCSNESFGNDPIYGVVKRCAYEVRADREGSREYDDGPRGGYDRGGGSRGGYGGGSGYRRPADDDF
jgi:hypothetical protein